MFDFWFVQNPWFPVQTQEFEKVKGDTLFSICIAGEKSCVFATSSVVELAFLWVSLLTEHIWLPQVSVSFSLFSWHEKPPHIFLSSVTEKNSN